jgi:hypothetical protein
LNVGKIRGELAEKREEKVEKSMKRKESDP